MPAYLNSRNLRNVLLMVVAMSAVMAAVWLLKDPLRSMMATADDVRAWLISLGPLAPAGYFAFYAAQIVFAPLPGSFMTVFGGYLFGFWWGLLLSLAALCLGVSVAMWIARRFGRGLLERFFPREELVKWERKMSLRSPIPWFVMFLFPIPDTAVYIAGLSSLSLRVLVPAILIGRGANVALGIAIGNASSVLPAEIVIAKWMALFLVGGIALRYQRLIRYWILVGARRSRRVLRLRTAPLRVPGAID
jgi:uncharacterized membrane protein YdjX (TVP38/TMEM64 family)